HLHQRVVHAGRSEEEAANESFNGKSTGENISTDDDCGPIVGFQPLVTLPVLNEESRATQCFRKILLHRFEWNRCQPELCTVNCPRLGLPQLSQLSDEMRIPILELLHHLPPKRLEGPLGVVVRGD